MVRSDPSRSPALPPSVPSFSPAAVTLTPLSSSAAAATAADNDRSAATPEAGPPPQRVSGAHALMDALHRHGVTHVFGYPGGAILPVYHELHKAEERGWLRHILVRHEQGGTHAADAMPGPPAKSASVSAPPVPVPPIW